MKQQKRDISASEIKAQYCNIDALAASNFDLYKYPLNKIVKQMINKQ